MIYSDYTPKFLKNRGSYTNLMVLIDEKNNTTEEEKESYFIKLKEEMFKYKKIVI